VRRGADIRFAKLRRDSGSDMTDHGWRERAENRFYILLVLDRKMKKTLSQIFCVGKKREDDSGKF
jgi:hypothetical protein